jgi:hypothetical protein
MVSKQFISKFKSGGKSALVIVKWSVIWLGSETGLDQVADDLKWLSGKGKNGRLDDKDEF